MKRLGLIKIIFKKKRATYLNAVQFFCITLTLLKIVITPYKSDITNAIRRPAFKVDLLIKPLRTTAESSLNEAVQT
jgi:hypothetical protein